MSQKEIISLLSREQEFKKVFLQLGNQKKIPYDILLLIYNLLRYQSQKEIESIKNFHLKNLYELTLIGWNINNHIDLDSKEFKSKLPMNRGPEWSIKWSPLTSNSANCSMKFNILGQIKVIGEKDYLYEKDYDNNNKYKQASLKTKLNYINKSPLFEIKEDYDEYLNNNKPDNYSIVIDNYGEGSVIWTPPGQLNYYNYI